MADAVQGQACLILRALFFPVASKSVHRGHGRQNKPAAAQGCPHPNPQSPCACGLTWPKGVWRCDQVKDLETGDYLGSPGCPDDIPRVLKGEGGRQEGQSRRQYDNRGRCQPEGDPKKLCCEDLEDSLGFEDGGREQEPETGGRFWKQSLP